jgi:hypothetical protein
MRFLSEGPMSCRVRGLRGIVFTVAAGCAALLLAPMSSAQSAAPGNARTASTPPAPLISRPAPPTESATRRGAQGDHEGITVHGHWVIEVRNPDGTVTTRREFENSLQPGGGIGLATLLTGNSISAGSWAILLNGNGNQPAPPGNGGGTAPGPCLPITYFVLNNTWSSGGPSTGGTCIITVPPNSSGNGTYWSIACANDQSGHKPEPCSMNLNVTNPSNSDVITFTGSVPVTASAPGTVNDVESVATLCAGTDATLSTPANCSAWMNTAGNIAKGTLNGYQVTFTQAILGQNGAPAPVPYNPGQTIAVTVTISFQ